MACGFVDEEKVRFRHSRERKRLFWSYHATILISAFIDLVMKWLNAVLFQKTFEKISISLSTTSPFDASSAFWKALFLSGMTFNEVIGLYFVVLLLLGLVSGGHRWYSRILAAKDEEDRRTMVLRAAVSGNQISSGADTENEQQVALILGYVSFMYEYEVFVRFSRIMYLEEMVFGIIIGLVILPLVTAIVVATLILSMLIDVVINNCFLNSVLEEMRRLKEKLNLRCLDIARCADVVATCNMQEKEESVVREFGAGLYIYEQKNARIKFVEGFLHNVVFPAMIPISLAVVFYTFESLVDENPIDLVFSLFAALTILDQTHKAKIYLSATDDQHREYKKMLKQMNEWLESRLQGIGDSERNPNYEGGDRSDSDNAPEHIKPRAEISLTAFQDMNDVEIGVGSSDQVWEHGDIVLNNVTVTYTGYSTHSSGEKSDRLVTNVLENRSFRFDFSRCTAIVGESGSGKSSILKVIGGLLEPIEGEVWIGSTRMSSSTKYLIRTEMVMCSQDSLLFARSIRENVWFGNTTPFDDEKIMDVLERVGLGGWLSKQESGLDEVLATGEHQVSGGQAQRLQLARLLCKNKRYVLLDEACSALDSENRKRILKELKIYMKNKTTIWVTHNPDVIAAADTVVDISRV